MRKLISPVAMTGLPIQIYQATHCCSAQLRELRSAEVMPSYKVEATNVPFDMAKTLL
jgi:hypothetical protein